jgi:hypothetical protein
VSAGFEPAGSVARWTNGYYAVRWYAPDGTRHGKQTKTLSEALELAQEWRANDHERAERYRLIDAATKDFRDRHSARDPIPDERTYANTH